MQCLYYTAKEIQDILGVSRAMAYRIIKELNQELGNMGYIVMAGKVPKKFFAKKYYGMVE